MHKNVRRSGGGWLNEPESFVSIKPLHVSLAVRCSIALGEKHISVSKSCLLLDCDVKTCHPHFSSCNAAVQLYIDVFSIPCPPVRPVDRFNHNLATKQASKVLIRKKYLLDLPETLGGGNESPLGGQGSRNHTAADDGGKISKHYRGMLG